MKKHTAYKYRIYPSKDQQDVLNKTFGCCRFVWNNILNWRSNEYSVNGVKTNYSASSKRLTAIKNEFEFLKDVSAVALQQVLRNQDVAFTGFFRANSKYPNFKRKHGYQSFRLADNAFRFKNKNLFIAKIEKPLKIVWSRKLPSEPSSCTISKTPTNKYYISFCVEKDFEELPKNNSTLGIDLGLKDFLVTSKGEKVKPLKALRKNEIRLKRYQKLLSRRTKGGKNREKARLKVAKVHELIANNRKDWLHKLSTKLIRENQLISLEDLNVKGMVKNHKLAKSINDSSWSTFVGFLEYKADNYGRIIHKVSPWFPSTQLCSDCGHRAGKLALNIRNWTCFSCGETHDRDINAAININTAGRAEIYDHGLFSNEIDSSNSIN
jgi:putative transposase